MTTMSHDDDSNQNQNQYRLKPSTPTGDIGSRLTLLEKILIDPILNDRTNGLRIGQMERSTLLEHGRTSFLRDRLSNSTLKSKL